MTFVNVRIMGGKVVMVLNVTVRRIVGTCAKVCDWWFFQIIGVCGYHTDWYCSVKILFVLMCVLVWLCSPWQWYHMKTFAWFVLYGTVENNTASQQMTKISKCTHESIDGETGVVHEESHNNGCNSLELQYGLYCTNPPILKKILLNNNLVSLTLDNGRGFATAQIEQSKH